MLVEPLQRRKGNAHDVEALDLAKTPPRIPGRRFHAVARISFLTNRIPDRA